MRVFTSVALLGAHLIASPALPQTPPAPFGEATHHVVRVDGLRFHYVTAGSGEPVVLLPGWPESWIAWRKLTPLLVKAGRQVYVLDPRGFGDSDKPRTSRAGSSPSIGWTTCPKSWCRDASALISPGYTRPRAPEPTRSSPPRSRSMSVSIPCRARCEPASPGTASISARKDSPKPRSAPRSGCQCLCWRSVGTRASATPCAQRSRRSATV